MLFVYLSNAEFQVVSEDQWLHRAILLRTLALSNHATLYSAFINRQIKTMEWIPWSNVLATGHVLLDTDHEYLVDLFNQLTVSVRQRKGKIACADLLDRIIQHTQKHFAFEEQLMAEHQYPKADHHADEHSRLINRAVNYSAKFVADSPGSHIPLIHFPEDWLTIHIVTADKELATFLSAKG